MKSLIVQGKDSRYVVDQEIGGTSEYRVYRCTREENPGQQLMLKIAATRAQNGALDREAFLLTTLRERAATLEAEYARIKPGGLLNYQIGFPNLVETFSAESQGGRRVLILSFKASDQVSDLVSLAMVRERDQVRVDPKTSAWVMGKTLKIMAFAHGDDITVGSVTGDDILIERGHHLVTFFDWSRATRHPGGVSHSLARAEISSAAREVMLLLGGDPNSGIIPPDEQLPDDCYQAFLAGLVRGQYHDASEAHSAFYQLVEVMWGRRFHPYASYPL